jgi:hypothetical protein
MPLRQGSTGASIHLPGVARERPAKSENTLDPPNLRCTHGDRKPRSEGAYRHRGTAPRAGAALGLVADVVHSRV